VNLPGLLYLFDIFAAVVFAVSGGLVAARKRMDVIGFMWLAVVTGVGVPLHDTPVVRCVRIGAGDRRWHGEGAGRRHPSFGGHRHGCGDWLCRWDHPRHSRSGSLNSAFSPSAERTRDNGEK